MHEAKNSYQALLKLETKVLLHLPIKKAAF
jgi:hypothetical protein